MNLGGKGKSADRPGEVSQCFTVVTPEIWSKSLVGKRSPMCKKYNNFQSLTWEQLEERRERFETILERELQRRAHLRTGLCSTPRALLMPSRTRADQVEPTIVDAEFEEFTRAKRYLRAIRLSMICLGFTSPIIAYVLMSSLV